MVYLTKEVSFQWLLMESRKLASRLTAQKYGIFCNDKLNCIIAILACLQKRKTVVMLCPEYGDSFNQKIKRNAGIKNYISDSLEGKIIINTESYEEEEELEEIAFIIYTSGSTGTSKGVLLTQQNIYENIKSTLKYYPINEESKVLLYRPIYHTTTVFGELLMSLIVGAKLYIEPSGMPLLYLSRVIKKNQITNLAGTPTFFTELLKASSAENNYNELRAISVGGERMSESGANAIRNGFSNVEVFHCYGMTEASPRVLYLPSNMFSNNYQCVGRPLDGVKVEVRNPVDSIGELFVSGPNIMKGYYRDSEATEKVLKDGWYATGDLGFQDEQGLYYVVGRKDDLCIRAGVNVWPQEVESAILKYPGVRSVYVYMEYQERNLLIAQVNGEKISQQLLMKWCVENLPGPYVPDRIEITEMVSMYGCGKRRKG